jgi:hypothetical protein
MTFDTPSSAPGTARTNMLIGLVPGILGRLGALRFVRAENLRRLIQESEEIRHMRVMMASQASA